MKQINKILAASLAALLIFTALIIGSCEKKAEKYTAYSFDCFDTVTTIIGYADKKEEFDRISGEILDELSEYHRLYDIYSRYEGLENLCTVNELSGGEHRTVSVDRRIIDMLLFAKDMYLLTDGAVNIAMGSVLSVWHDYRQRGEGDPFNAELPPIDMLLKAAEHTDIDDLIIDEKNNTVMLRDPEMKLDVGAVAKGYAVEMIARSLYEKGIEGYVINVGGNVRTVGGKPDGEGFTVGIQDPDPEAGDYLAYLSLKDRSLVTSGSYHRYYTVDGKRYHHIIDRESLMPADKYVSVSVVCESSAMGDALSTALFCMDLEEGRRLIESLESVEAMWVTTDGDQYRSSGFEDK